MTSKYKSIFTDLDLESDYSAVRKSSNILHVAINILLIVLLGAPNFTMQCLIAPTRRDINKAHSKG